MRCLKIGILLGLCTGSMLQAQHTIDVPAALSSGAARITATQFDIGGINEIFDGNTTSLARSANINPMVLTLEFNERIPISGMRLYIITPGSWSIEAADSLADLENRTGTYRMLFDARPLTGEVWDTATLSQTARIWRLSVRRLLGDNFVHLNEWEISTNLAPAGLSISSVQTEMYPTWRTTLAARATGTIPLKLSGVQWRSLDTAVAAVGNNGVLAAIAPGTARVEATLGSLTAQWEVPVRAPARAPEIVASPAGLSQPAPNALFEIPVIIIRYLPTRDGTNIDTSYDSDFWGPGEITVEAMKQRLDTFDRRVKFILEEGSRFRGYKNPSARPSIGYKVLYYITVYEPTPPGTPNTGDNPVRYFVDYASIFTRFNVRQMVEDLGVKEIWFWMGTIGPEFPSYNAATQPPDRFRSAWESEMSGPNGRVCNCGMSSGLPQYNRTYVLYNQNVRRTEAEAVHNHGHQLEAILSFANLRDSERTLFWDRFSGRDALGRFQRGRCGNTHYPPNGERDYDYSNMNPYPSDCEDWVPPGGPTKPVSAATWRAIPYNWPDPGASNCLDCSYYLYWMQNMPGAQNGIRHAGGVMSNWWQFTADWDAASTARLGLMQPDVQATVGTPPAPPATGGRFTIPVTLPPNVPWMAVANDPWIRLSLSGGVGSGQVEIVVEPNSGPAREGSVVIAGQRITIRQAASAGAELVSYAFAQVAAGGTSASTGAGRWSTSFYFTNTGDTQAQVSLRFNAPTGEAWLLPTTEGSRSLWNATLPSRGSVFLAAPGGAALEQGSALVEASPAVRGYAVFRQSVDGRPDQEAVSPLADLATGTQVIMWDDAAAITTVAVANPGNISITVTATARDSAGAVLGSFTVPLPALGREAFVLRDRLPPGAIAGKRGVLEISAGSSPVAILGLRFAGSAFTSIPPARR